MTEQPKTNPLPVSKSKYEFNLAEFPITIISSGRLNKETPTSYTYKDTIPGSNGKIINREWKISHNSEYGWGSNQLGSIIFELFQIWKEQGFPSRIIHFGSIHNLIRRIGLPNDGKTYKRIKNDLKALVGLVYEAKSAFWDNEKKLHVNMVGHLFEHAILVEDEEKTGQRALPFCQIIASKQLFDNIQANALITIDPGGKFFHSLTPTEQRLGLYLTKMLHNTNEVRRKVELLASQIPILAQDYKNIKRQITRACDGLIKKGFLHLANYSFEKSTSGEGENIVFRKTSKQNQNSTGEEKSIISEEATIYLTEDILEACGDEQSRQAYSIIASKLPSLIIYRMLSEIRQEYPGTFTGSRGALFIVKAKQEAKRLGIDLRFKISSSEKPLQAPRIND